MNRASTTLKFVKTAFAALMFKYVTAGVALGPLGIMPEMGATEFGIAFAAILAPWLHREYVRKVKQNEVLESD